MNTFTTEQSRGGELKHELAPCGFLPRDSANKVLSRHKEEEEKKDSTKYSSAHHVMWSKKGSMCLSKLMIINDQ